jgi:hypothetical protein
MDFLNTKTIFLHFGFYNMFVNSKGCWLILQKYKNLIYILQYLYFLQYQNTDFKINSQKKNTNLSLSTWPMWLGWT